MISPNCDIKVLVSKLSGRDLGQVVRAVLSEIRETDRFCNPLAGSDLKKYRAALELFLDYLIHPKKPRTPNEMLPKPLQDLFHELNTEK